MSQDRLLVIIIIIISLFSILSYLASPFFHIHEVKVRGVKYTDNKQILASLSGFKEKNIWLVDKNKITNIIKQNKYIKEISVDKNFPDSLIIRVKEREPLAKIKNDGKYLVFSAEGYILEEGALNSVIGVPEIEGMGYSFSDSKLIFPSEIDKIVQALEEINFNKRKMISRIKVNLEKNNFVLILSSQDKVYMGKLENYTKKFKVLASILEKISQENLDIEYIDLRIIEKPVIKK